MPKIYCNKITTMIFLKHRSVRTAMHYAGSHILELLIKINKRTKSCMQHAKINRIINTTWQRTKSNRFLVVRRSILVF